MRAVQPPTPLSPAAHALPFIHPLRRLKKKNCVFRKGVYVCFEQVYRHDKGKHSAKDSKRYQASSIRQHSQTYVKPH